eukprot:3580613-Rhodomonas_salina.1
MQRRCTFALRTTRPRHVTSALGSGRTKRPRSAGRCVVAFGSVCDALRSAELVGLCGQARPRTQT